MVLALDIVAAPVRAGGENPSEAGVLGHMDWHIDELGVRPGVGTLYSWLLLMTDRYDGSTSRIREFSDRWGGGRFQMRYWGNNGSGADEGGVWGWEAAEYTVNNSTGDIMNTMFGTAAEPSTLNQFKAYMTFFEKNNSHAADIDLEIWKENCTGSWLSNRIGYDISYDTKSMARASASAAAGQHLCGKINTLHVPGTQTRKVILIMYYSNSTDFR